MSGMPLSFTNIRVFLKDDAVLLVFPKQATMNDIILFDKLLHPKRVFLSRGGRQTFEFQLTR